MYRRGDVVIVLFPFTDLSDRKQRPALVVSPDTYNCSSDDVVLLAITSQLPATLDPALQVEITDADIAPARWPKKSMVLIPKLFICDQGIIQKHFATVSQTFMADVLAKLRQFFS